MDATFLGRAHELDALHRRFEEAASGQGGLVLIAGEAGVGKTTIAEHVVARHGWPLCLGRATETAASPYGPLAQALREARRQVGPAEPPEPVAACLPILLPELGDAPEAVDRELLVEAVAMSLAAGAPAPIAVLLDDLQWADEATLDVLPRLADRLRHEPVLVLATYRSDEIIRGHAVRRLRDDLRRARRLTEIEIGPLDAEETARLVADGLGAPPSPELARRVHDRTLGVPLFVEELTATLAARGLVMQQETGFELREGETIPLPESVRDAVVLRLDGLPEDSREPLEIAAVAGTEFEVALVTDLAGGDGGMRELLDRRFLHETGAGRAAFRHALTREAIAGEILSSRRRELHRKIARWLEERDALPEPIAEHWLAAHDHEPARHALVAAADRSCRLHAHRDAARFAQRALEIWPDEAEEGRLDVLSRLAQCAQLGGLVSEAVRAWREVVESATVREDPARLGEAQRALAIAQESAGQWEQSMASRAAARESFLTAGDPGSAAIDRLAQAGHHTAALQLTTAADEVREAAELAERGGRPDVQARALGLEGVVLAMRGEVEPGITRVREGLTLALEHGSVEAAADVYRRLGNVLDYASDFAGAREAYVEALDFCRAQGQEGSAQVCLGCMSWIFLRTGEWSRALEVCHEVREDAPPGTVGSAKAVIGLVHAYRGETGPARKNLEHALELVRQAEVTTVEAIIGFGLAMLEENAGNDDTAAERYREMVRAWSETQDRHDIVPGLWHGVTFFASRGQAGDAARCTDALVEITTAAANAEHLGALAHALGETALASGDAVEAIRHFRQAGEHLDELEAPAERVLTTLRTAAALDAAGERAEAVRVLSGAYRVARRLGARPLAARVAESLGAMGESVVERGAPAGDAGDRAGLTRRQIEVARLLAEGHTNREIAKRLFVSPRTIDMHVSHILERLDCRSRAEAARRATELGLLTGTASD